jgi:hypothetical protein
LGSKKWTVVIIIIAVLAISFVAFEIYMVAAFQQATDRVLSPIEKVNSDLQTRAAMLLHPTATIIPDPVTIIHEVRALARLETIQYSVEKVITAEIGQGDFGFLFGDRLLFVAHGVVIAGVDMQKLTSDDIRLEGDILYVTLPDPEIFVATLDNDKSYIYDREIGFLTKGSQSLETKARQAAEQEIINAALADGILDLARQNAENYLGRLFANLGYSQVIFLDPTTTP